MITTGHAEDERVPFADTSVYKVPEGLSDEQVLFVADILPTAYEVGVLNGRVDPTVFATHRFPLDEPSSPISGKPAPPGTS